MIPADTSPEAYAVQIRLMRNLSTGERLRRVMDLCDFARELHRVSIRRRHPEFDESEVHREFARLMLAAPPDA